MERPWISGFSCSARDKLAGWTGNQGRRDWFAGMVDLVTGEIRRKTRGDWRGGVYGLSIFMFVWLRLSLLV